MSEFYRKVEIGSLTKTEYDKYGVLRVPVTFKVLTPWYKPAPMDVEYTEESENAFIYDQSIYDENLIYGIGATDYSVEINPVGHVPAAVKLTFAGSVVNPKILLVGVSTGKLLGECDITGVFSVTDKLEFSSMYQNCYVKKIRKDNSELDLIDSIDITKECFFRVPLTEPCRLIMQGRGISGKIRVEIYSYYRAV